MRISAGKIIINGLLVLQIAVYMEYLFSGNPNSVYFCGAFGFIGLCYCILTDSKRRNNIVISGLCVICILGVGMLFHRYYSLSNIFRELLTFFAMGCLLTRKELSKKGALIGYYIILAIIIAAIIKTGYPYQIFASKSRNYISAILIAMMFPYYIACANSKEEPSIVPAAATFLVSVYVVGRSGIICSAFLFFVSLLRRNFREVKRVGRYYVKIRWKYWLLSLLVVGTCIYVAAKTNVLATYFYRFLESGYAGDRSSIWSEYFNILTDYPMCWIIGVNFNYAYYLSIYQNAHNSFLMVHAYLGIIGIASIMVIIVRYIMEIKTDRNWDILILVFSFLLRSFTDWVFMLDFGDIILFYMLFSVSKVKNKTVYIAEELH